MAHSEYYHSHHFFRGFRNISSNAANISKASCNVIHTHESSSLTANRHQWSGRRRLAIDDHYGSVLTTTFYSFPFKNLYVFSCNEITPIFMDWCWFSWIHIYSCVFNIGSYGFIWISTNANAWTYVEICEDFTHMYQYFVLKLFDFHAKKVPDLSFIPATLDCQVICTLAVPPHWAILLTRIRSVWLPARSFHGRVFWATNFSWVVAQTRERFHLSFSARLRHYWALCLVFFLGESGG